MIKLYANENFPFPVVEELRKMGYDVLTTMDAGKAGQSEPDGKVLFFAKSKERVLLTLNRKHFVKLHNEKSDHCGIIACSFDPDFKSQALKIDEAIRNNEDFKGKLIRINRL
jgi:hypothetical protein